MSEAVVRLLVDERESGLLVDVVGGGENALRPEGDFAVAGGAGELDALIDEDLAQAEATRGGLYEQEAELCGVRLIGMMDEEDAAERDSVAFGDPAAVADGIVLVDEVGGDAGGKGLKGFIPMVFLRVESAVAGDDPVHVSGAMMAKDI